MERDVVAAEQRSAVADPWRARAFEEWVSPHWSVMSHFAVRLVGAADGEDVVQEALSVAWRKWARFDPARGSARTWLLTIVADQARKLRRRRVRSFRPEQPAVESPDMKIERAIDLERAIGRLSRRQRLAIDLYYYLDLPIADVAAIMRCAEGTVKSTLADARTHLHTYLGDELK